MLCGVAVLLFFPNHRLSNNASIRVDAPGVALCDTICIASDGET